MATTLAQFYQSHPIGTSVAKPFFPFDYLGECVSYVLTKAVEVDGVPFSSPMGHAAQIPYNATFLRYYEPVSDPIEGDLMFWGDDPGTWTGPEGHTALYDSPGYMMNQNFNGSRVISRNKIFTPGFIGYFRRKGATMENEDLITDKDIDILRICHSEIGGWDLNKTHAGDYDEKFLATYKGKSMREMIRNQWRNGAGFRDKREAALNAKPTDAELSLRAIKNALGIK